MAFVSEHAAPHAPHAVTVLRRSVSQPLAAIPSQLPKPALQAMPHAPIAQVGVALARAGQAFPHAPQFETLAVRSVSQPLPTIMSQSPRPLMQPAMRHTEASQVAVPPEAVHMRAHAPQFEALVRVSTSQPSAASPLQSEKPATHDTTQAPSTQPGKPLGRAGHSFMQRPQWVTLVRTLVSQPLVALPSQSPKPSSQRATVHRPATHAGVPLGGLHTEPHDPQLPLLVRVSTSQPSVTSPLQSAKPALQAKAQRPPSHDTAALARAGQAFPHAPQLVTLVRVSVSQPLEPVMSQSAKGAEQVPTPQLPLRQADMALGTAQRVPQTPQLAMFDCVSTQAPEQHVWPVGQRDSAVHPTTQVLPTQSVPGAQSALPRHSTQVLRAVSQRPCRATAPSGLITPPSVAVAHPSSDRQPDSQVFVVELQCCVAGHVSAEATHCTQLPVAVSQTPRPGSVRQSDAPMQRGGPLSIGVSIGVRPSERPSRRPSRRLRARRSRCPRGCRW